MFRNRRAARVARSLILGGLVVAAESVAAQEQPPAVPTEHVHPTPAAEVSTPQVHQHEATTASLFAPRETSGTAWQPDVTPMYGLRRQTHGWEVMLHGNAYLQLFHESAPEHRGDTQAGSINWGMAMARRPLGEGRLGLRVMMSLEPWTVPGCGYPNLLQTGEICDGDSIHDKQHPHDLIMEVAAEFDRPLTGSLRWQLYGGVAGEPALGPPGFPHRASAMPNPISPIVHHWLDATHISFGLVTAGVYDARWKAEASVFNGREPDEARLDVNLAPLDSISGRLSFMPRDALVVQVSAGRLLDAEKPFPSGVAIDIVRLTSSASYHRRSPHGSLWATTIAWGANRKDGETTHGVLLESNVNRSDGHTVFGRVEVSGKPAHDLHVHESTGVFTVGKLQGGYTRYLAARHGLQPGVGATVSAALVPSPLRPRYGGVGVGVGLFVTMRPTAHQMAP
jgi:hypothetical protein